MSPVQELANRFDAAKAFIPGKRIKFDFGDAGKVLLDGVAAKVSPTDGDADTTLQMSFDDFMKMANGQLDGTMAFMQGKLKVLGDMSLAMQLQSVLAKVPRD